MKYHPAFSSIDYVEIFVQKFERSQNKMTTSTPPPIFFYKIIKQNKLLIHIF